jgi:hypothetical protein
MQQFPLPLFNRLLGTLGMWAVVLGAKTAIRLHWVDQFHQSAFLDRVREALFLDYVVESIREAKRRKKFWKKVDGQSGTLHHTFLRPNSKELRRRAKFVITPKSLLENEDVASGNTVEWVPAHVWKRLLDHFYHVVLMDNQVLEELEGDADQYDESLLKALEDTKKILDARKNEKQDKSFIPEKAQQTSLTEEYHHLHHFGFYNGRRRINQRRVQAYTLDERASKLATKLFKSLKRPELPYLDLKEDILPLFQTPISSVSIAFNNTNDMQQDDQDALLLNYRRASSISVARRTPKEIEEEAAIKRQQDIARGVYNFFLTRSDDGKLSERELRFTVLRANRERMRLVSSLSGLRSSVQRINDFSNFLLGLILIMTSLTIFGVDAFGAMLSFSSALVSFAFFFGGSARSLFESVVFVFFIHVRCDK